MLGLRKSGLFTLGFCLGVLPPPESFAGSFLSASHCCIITEMVGSWSYLDKTAKQNTDEVVIIRACLDEKVKKKNQSETERLHANVFLLILKDN